MGKPPAASAGINSVESNRRSALVQRETTRLLRVGRGGPVLLVLLPNCPIVPGGKGSLMWGSTVIHPRPRRSRILSVSLGAGDGETAQALGGGGGGHCHLSFTAASPSTVPRGFEPNAAGSEFPHDPTLRTVFDMSENLIYKNETKRGEKKKPKKKKGHPIVLWAKQLSDGRKNKKKKKKKSKPRYSRGPGVRVCERNYQSHKDTFYSEKIDCL